MPAFRRRLSGLVAALAVISPAWAGDRLDLGAPALWQNGLPHAADTGKPALRMPQPGAGLERDGCAAPLPCGMRLLGTVRKNGAVELQVPALRW